jgi:hypothetical protein
MKTELYRKGINIQLLDHLIHNLNMSYNDLTSTATDQEGIMKACEAAEDKKRKRTMPWPIGGRSTRSPPKFGIVYMPPMEQPRRPPQF